MGECMTCLVILVTLDVFGKPFDGRSFDLVEKCGDQIIVGLFGVGKKVRFKHFDRIDVVACDLNTSRLDVVGGAEGLTAND